MYALMKYSHEIQRASITAREKMCHLHIAKLPYLGLHVKKTLMTNLSTRKQKTFLLYTANVKLELFLFLVMCMY